jgi:hypothetical protein
MKFVTQKYKKNTYFCEVLNGLSPIYRRMEVDTLTNMHDATQWSVSPLVTDSTLALAKQWQYSQDSALYHGSGFWFEDVLQYLRQHDNFGIVRHQALLRPDKFTSESLMLGLLLFEVFLVAFLLKRGLNLIVQFTQSGIGSTDISYSFKDGVKGLGFSKFLWILTLVIFSLMGHVLINLHTNRNDYTIDSTQILRLFGFTFSFFILLDLLFRLVGGFFFSLQIVERWRYNNKATLFIYAMILSPVLIGAEIGVITDEIFLLFWTFGFLIIAKFWMIVKTIRIFSISKGGFFYFILYLCALEILPILLYYKGLFLL